MITDARERFNWVEKERLFGEETVGLRCPSINILSTSIERDNQMTNYTIWIRFEESRRIIVYQKNYRALLGCNMKFFVFFSHRGKLNTKR